MVSALIPYLGLVLLALFGFAANEVLRRSAWLAWACFLALPLGLTPYWRTVNPDTDWFFWLKIYSVFLACWWVLLLRYTSLKKHRWAFAVIYAILIINILEAVSRGFLTRQLTDILTGLAGLLLIVTMPPIRTVAVSAEKNRDLLWDVPMAWILGFTIWDTVFMYLTFPGSAGRTFSALAAPLLTALLIDKKLWGQGRPFVLALFLIIAFTFPHAGDILSVPRYTHPYAEIVLSSLSLIWMAVYAVRRFSNFSHQS